MVNTPTYYRSDSEFWSSRKQGYPEEEASSSAATLNSTRGEVTSPEREDISPTIEDFLERQVEVEEYTMDPATNQILAAELSKLEVIRDKIEYNVSRLSPEKITVHIVTTVQDKLKDIIALSDEYGFGMTQLLKKYPTLKECFRLQYQADVKTVHSTVDDLEQKIMEKIYSLQPQQPSVPGPPTQVSNPATGTGIVPLSTTGVSAQTETIVAKAKVK